MIATLAIVRVTARNVLGLRRLVLFGLLAILPAGLFTLLSRTSTQIDRAEGFTTMALVIFLGLIVPIATIVMSASVLGSERRGNTLSFLMLRPLSRFAIAGAKLASALVASFAITSVGALLLGLAGGLLLDDFSYLVALLVATLIATAGYVAVFMPLGYLTERATLIGFIYVFIWELTAAGALAALRGTSLLRIGGSAFVGLAPEGLHAEVVDAMIGSLSPSASDAGVKMLVLCAISILFTGWLLRTRDLT